MYATNMRVQFSSKGLSYMNIIVDIHNVNKDTHGPIDIRIILPIQRMDIL